MQKDRKKRVGLLAVMLTALLSCFAIGATTARYYSEMQGSDKVAVAKFDIKVDGATDPILVDVKTDTVIKDYRLTVSNHSEVAVNCKIKVTTSKALPTGISLEVLEIPNSKIACTGQTQFLFDDGVWVAGTQTEKSYTLRFTFLPSTEKSIADVMVNVGVLAEQYNPTGV